MKALEGQSFLDIAIQETGSVDSAYFIALKADMSITDEPLTTTDIDTLNVVAAPIKQYFSSKGLRPSTGINASKDEEKRIFDYTFDYTFN